MKLAKAKEILEIETGSRHIPSDPDLYNAQKLAIEALEFVIEYQTLTPRHSAFKLPSETENTDKQPYLIKPNPLDPSI